MIVQDSCRSGGEQSLRRAHGVPDQRPPVVHAFSWAFLSGSPPRRPHDLAIPREAHEEPSKHFFERSDAMLREVGYIAMSGQIVDASLIAAPRQRNTNDEKKAIKEGRIPDEWKEKPAKLRHKDRDARWTVKFTKAKPSEDGSSPMVDLAIPVFGYQNHISIDRGFGFIRQWSATDAAAYEGRRLREGLLDKNQSGERRMGGYRLPPTKSS
jgi:hypothetical protein